MKLHPPRGSKVPGLLYITSRSLNLTLLAQPSAPGESRVGRAAVFLGRDKIIVWFCLHVHTAQKVGSVGWENILFWTKILCRPLLNYRVKWTVQNSEAWHHTHTHTHTECTPQHAVLSLI